MEFLVENVKCGGCVANITKGLEAVEGVTGVLVDIPTGKVQFGYQGDKDEAFFKKLLSDLGYPVKGSKNRFSIFGRW